MAKAIVIEDDIRLHSVLAKMRRYNISRLPVINSNEVVAVAFDMSSMDDWSLFASVPEV
jgi:CBS domain-containing protein